MTIDFRGWAVRGCAEIDGIVETVVPGAWDLRGQERVLFGTHDGTEVAWSANRTLTLFESHGRLGFECRVSGAVALSVQRAVLNREITKCSVQMRDMKCTEANGRRRITFARVNHLSLVPYGAYPNTAVWLANVDVEDLPADVRGAAEEWESAKRVHDRASSGARSGPVAGVRNNGDSARSRMFLHAARHAHVRNSTAGSWTADRRPSPAQLAQIDDLLRGHYGDEVFARLVGRN